MRNMKKYNYVAPFHQREGARLKSLHATKLLDSAHSVRFDVITDLAATVFKVPTALISLVDSDRQWCLSSYGKEEEETHRDQAFCSHAINEKELLVVEDTQSHPIFKNHPLVTGKPYIRFYAGAVIRGDDSLPLGTLSIIDQVPRRFYEQEHQSFLSMAKLVRQEIVQPAEITTHRIRSWTMLFSIKYVSHIQKVLIILNIMSCVSSSLILNILRTIMVMLSLMRSFWSYLQD
jgi:hypothetical protein